VHEDVRRKILPLPEHTPSTCLSFLFPYYPQQNSREYNFDLEVVTVLHIESSEFDILNVYFRNPLCPEELAFVTARFKNLFMLVYVLERTIIRMHPLLVISELVETHLESFFP
jgi:hypothetical protein